MRYLTMPAALLLLLSIACNSPMNKESVQDASAERKADASSKTEAADTAAGKVSGQAAPAGPIASAAPSAPVPNPDWDKKIVKTANMTLEVKNFKSFDGVLHRTVRQAGGYISSETQALSEYKV